MVIDCSFEKNIVAVGVSPNFTHLQWEHLPTRMAASPFTVKFGSALFWSRVGLASVILISQPFSTKLLAFNIFEVSFL